VTELEVRRVGGSEGGVVRKFAEGVEERLARGGLDFFLIPV